MENVTDQILISSEEQKWEEKYLTIAFLSNNNKRKQTKMLSHLISPRKLKHMCTEKHTDIYSSFTHDNLKLATTQTPVNR